MKFQTVKLILMKYFCDFNGMYKIYLVEFFKAHNKGSINKFIFSFY